MEDEPAAKAVEKEGGADKEASTADAAPKDPATEGAAHYIRAEL